MGFGVEILVLSISGTMKLGGTINHMHLTDR
jgi:hypothetical protein